MIKLHINVQYYVLIFEIPDTFEFEETNCASISRHFAFASQYLEVFDLQKLTHYTVSCTAPSQVVS